MIFMSVTDKRVGREWDKDPKCNPRFQQRSRSGSEIKMLIRQSSIRMGGIHESSAVFQYVLQCTSPGWNRMGSTLTQGGERKKLFAKPEIDDSSSVSV